MNLVFDIGFNRGKFSDACLDKSPNCRIVGVEPNPSLFYSHTGNSNIKLINALVSDKNNDKKDFYIDASQDGISTASTEFMKNSRFAKGSKYLNEGSGNWVNVGKVKTITLDTMVEFYGKPDLIKVDVEGYEYEVFSGLSKKAKKICFECHEEETEKMNKIIEHLIDLGYRQFGLIGYFDEGDKFEKLTYSEKGDPYLVEPNKYYSWKDLKEDIDICFQEDRRVNYGMIWAK
jgi:FkbM family methyltransferase